MLVSPGASPVQSAIAALFKVVSSSLSGRLPSQFSFLISVEMAAFGLTDNPVFEAFLSFAFWIKLCVFSFFWFLFYCPSFFFFFKKAVFPGSMFRPLMYLYLDSCDLILSSENYHVFQSENFIFSLNPFLTSSLVDPYAYSTFLTR